MKFTPAPSSYTATPVSSTAERPALDLAEDLIRLGLWVYLTPPGSKGAGYAGTHGSLEATRDLDIIREGLRKHPGADIAIRTGLPIEDERGGYLCVVDYDSTGAIERNPGLSTETYTVRSGSKRGVHEYVRVPEPFKSSIGELDPDIDIRCAGSQVPSPGSWHKSGGHYESIGAGFIDDAAPELIKRLREQQGAAETVSEGDSSPVRVDFGESFFKRTTRHHAAVKFAGQIHDGTRSEAQILTETRMFYAKRCEGEPDPGELERIAAWIHKTEPCGRSRPSELVELCNRISDAWHDSEWYGIAGKADARFIRAILARGWIVGTVIAPGLRVELSYRDLADILGIHHNSVYARVRSLRMKGLIRKDDGFRKDGGGGAFVILDPRNRCDTLTDSLSTAGREIGGGVTVNARPPLYGLTTTHYRHRGPVGYSREHALVKIETYGEIADSELAEEMNIARVRDLRRRVIEPLAELGLIERHGDVSRFPGSSSDRVAEARRKPYSTVQQRICRYRDGSGRWNYEVRYSGSFASEEQRAEIQRRRHKDEQERYHNLAARATNPEIRDAVQPSKALQVLPEGLRTPENPHVSPVCSPEVNLARPTGTAHNTVRPLAQTPETTPPSNRDRDRDLTDRSPNVYSLSDFWADPRKAPHYADAIEREKRKAREHRARLAASGVAV